MHNWVELTIELKYHRKTINSGCCTAYQQLTKQFSLIFIPVCLIEILTILTIFTICRNRCATFNFQR